MKKIDIPNYELDIATVDFKYTVKINKNNEEKERQEKIIIFGLKERINLFKNKNYKEYFLDVTFKIIHRIYHPYKLMTIVSLDIYSNKTVLICFVLLKFLDKTSYFKIFQYLHDNLFFDPIIIHTDFENSLGLAIKEANFFSNEIIHIRCLFNFIELIRTK